MKKEIVEQFVGIIKEYQKELKGSQSLDESKFLDVLLLDMNEYAQLDKEETIEDYLANFVDRQEWADGGYKKVMYPNVDENDEEYQHNIDNHQNADYKMCIRTIKLLEKRYQNLINK